jgi:TatD DNase family protein
VEATAQTPVAGSAAEYTEVEGASSAGLGKTSHPEPDAEAPGPEALLSAIDTHCHLFLMEEDPAHVVAAAQSAGVGRLICVGVDHESSLRSRELAESLQGVFATAGVHPHSASEFDSRVGSAIEELLADRLVVAVGETGLDYYRRLSPPEEQRRAFRTHIALSRESGKPLVVHVREAWEDSMAILEGEGAERVVLHCFSGNQAVATEAMARGYFVSFAANVTYPNADSLRRAVRSVDEDRLLAETDSPFLPPQALRGRPNHPANVRTVLGQLGQVRGVNLDHMIEATTRAAIAAFPLLP